MPKKVWTEEEKKAFAEKMKAGREKAILSAAGADTPPTPPNPSIVPNTHETPEATTSPDAPETAKVEQDPQIAAKLKELQEAIDRTNAFNAQLEKSEQERTVKFDAGLKSISPEENKQVIEVHKSKAMRMKEHLAKQPKVQVFVPLEGKEKMGTQLPVTLNGYGVKIPKGMYVEVPQQIAEVIMDSLNQTQQALDNKYNIDNADEKTATALS